MFSRRVGPGQVCVLTYHGVLPEGWRPAESPIEGTLLPAEKFRVQLRFLKARYNLISPEEFHGWLKEDAPLPERAVLLTCDDGFLNVLTEMVPILLEEGVRCLFFVTGASLEETPQNLWYEGLYRLLIDAPGDVSRASGSDLVRKDSFTVNKLAAFWWELVEDLSAKNGLERKEALGWLQARWRLPQDWRMNDPGDSRAERRYRLLNRAELLKLANHGMTVGAHTLSHPLLPKMSAELAEQEIRECKLRIESCLQREVWALAYPFGHGGSVGAREMDIAERAGYACAFLNHGGGLLGRTSPRFGLPRAHVTAQMNLPEFEAHLSGFHEALQRRFRGAAGSSLCA
jgi:peptidoglycan/xylan/chitin deacetylase (PgdA/CDA1 family)